ncbi:actin cortical patch SUR7/pH-response regulator pali [Cerioporus squamosus]|nr:actin cortical patch SUR7/pH-response regulator pali [Cerioporus squamosus]
MLAKLSSLFLFVSFLLLFLVSLSIPIIKSIYLFQLSAGESSSLLHSSASGSVRFGVWGYCTSDTSVEVLGSDHTSAGSCSKAHLGYTFDSQVANDLHVDGLTDAISATLSAALVLHVVDCILTFIAFVSSLFVRKWRAGSTVGPGPLSRPAFLATILAAILAAILTTISFIIDLVFVSVVSNKISDEADGVLHVARGNAVAMTIASAVLLWVAIVLSSMDVFVGRRHARRNPQMTEKGTSV